MRKFILSTVVAAALSSSAGFAADPTSDLLPAAAVRLVAMKANVPEHSIEICFIIEGVSKCDKGFEATHVRRVAAIHPVRGNGGQTRSLEFYELLWNDSLGWFMWEARPERAGDAVYIWSEFKGLIVNR